MEPPAGLTGFLLIGAGYLAGSIPWGLLLARWYGVDVRRTGSGNIGAANVARSAGAWLGLVTLGADAAKSALPVLLARGLDQSGAIVAGTGLAAFLGHLFPVTLRFAVGKGVATALGVLAVIAPGAAAVALAVFAVTFAAGRWASLASVLAALAAPVATALLDYPGPTLTATLVMSGSIVLRHRENLARLRAGREPRFHLPKKQALPRN